MWFKKLTRFFIVLMFALAGLMLNAPPPAQAASCSKVAKRLCKRAKRSKKRKCVRIAKKACKRYRKRVKRKKRRVRRTYRRSGNRTARCIRSRCRGKRGQSLIRCIRRCR